MHLGFGTLASMLPRFVAEQYVIADVNDGMNTRDMVKAHDPLLATLLMQTYGDGPWCYTHTMPRDWGGGKR